MFDEQREISSEPTRELESGAVLRAPLVRQAALFADLDLCPVAKKNPRLKPAAREALLKRVDSTPFNRDQEQVVRHTLGPLRVNAGAGSGKTFVVTNRMARLIALGVIPKRILAVTFTKKAAEEMQDRCKNLIREFVPLARPTICTLHSLGYRILQQHGAAVNYHQGARIISEMDADVYLREALNTLDTDALRLLPRDKIRGLATVLSGWKSEGIGPREIEERGDPLAPAYTEYQKWLLRSGFVDFDDLIRLPRVIFEQDPEALAYWQRQFDFVLVDEYQDTNTAQDNLLSDLAAEHRNLCVVGDDNQSIYGWRGARVELIRKFARVWPGSTSVTLDTNYRSTGAILEVGNNLIARSTEHQGKAKALRSVKGEGLEPTLQVFADQHEEASWIAHQIRSSKRPPGDFAVLVRDQFKATAIEHELARREIPYQLFFGDTYRLGELKRNAYSVLSAIDRPSRSEAAFLQLLHPSLGVHGSPYALFQRDYEALLDIREQEQAPLWRVICSDAVGHLSSDGQDKVSLLRELISELHEGAHPKNRRKKRRMATLAREAYAALYPEAVTQDEWNNENTKNPTTQTLRTIVQRVATYERDARPHNRNFKSFLEFQLVEIPRRIREGQQKKKTGESRHSVWIMSMHAAKGLEFPVVFLPHFVDQVIPSKQSVDERGLAGLEEERRLAYVAATRAEEELHVSYPTEVTNARGERRRLPSPFIADMGLEE